MPKINVYLPDDLAAAVREAGVPVSGVCQAALAEAVRRAGAARKVVEALRDPGFDSSRLPHLDSRLDSRMTLRLREALRLAREASQGRLETSHLLAGLLAERHNLAVRLLQTLGVDPDELASEAQRARDEKSPGGAGPDPAPPHGSSWLAVLTVAARRALASALEASIDLGHNYLGSEHLLLGLLAEEDGGAGRALRGFGVDAAGARRAVATAAAGFAHARESSEATVGATLEDVLRRLEAVERRLEQAQR